MIGSLKFLYGLYGFFVTAERNKFEQQPFFIWSFIRIHSLSNFKRHMTLSDVWMMIKCQWPHNTMNEREPQITNSTECIELCGCRIISQKMSTHHLDLSSVNEPSDYQP